MQRKLSALACFFICVNCFSQQYPFVHYTPKDGLVNSRVRKAYQDSKGRMYFLTFGGLSVYDGARFKNYTTQDGLAATLVNDILEVGDDSLLVATNNGYFLNVLVRGKIGILKTESDCPVINQFYRHDNNKIYISSDNGLFVLENKKILELNISSLKERSNNLPYLNNITGIGNWLVFSINETDLLQGLYLYDIENNRICDSFPKTGYLIGKDESNRIWASFSDKLFNLDTVALAKGKLLLISPTGGYQQAKNYSTINVAFDKNSAWLVFRNKEYRNIEIRRIEENGTLLKMPLPDKAMSSAIKNILVDKENTIWICNDGEGVFKIVNSSLQVFENPFGKSFQGYVDDAFYFNEVTWYSTNINKLFRKSQKGTEEFSCNMKTSPEIFHYDGKKLMARDYRNMYEGELNDQRKTIYFHRIISLPDSDYLGKRQIVDRNGIIVAVQKIGLVVWKSNKPIFHLPVFYPELIEELAFDKNNFLWIVKRYSGAEVFSLHPENISKYLQPVLSFSKEQLVGSPRSFVIDKTGLIWIGTREDGLVCYRQEGNRLKPLFHFHAGNGLTNNFVTTLACDSLNNIIVGTQMGLDRILYYGGNSFRIENLSKSSNFFAQISQAWADEKHAFARSSSGVLLQLSPPGAEKMDNAPQLLLEEMKVNAQSVSAKKKKFQWRQNNISFSVAAPSFIDEKQVAFSYLLEGSGNKQWSDTTAANAVINLTNLSAGKYVLKVNAFFPSTSYAPAELSYSFEITPPWWQTWWLRSIVALLIIGLLIIGLRFYYRRKLEKQKAILEKQQAIEKERTRIATDMHDDLGAGLSRIKFLSQSIHNKKLEDETIKTELEKITRYSDEMTEKMGEIVWALNEKNDTLADLVAYTRSYAVEYLATHNIQCDANTPLRLPGTFITGEMRRNIFLSVKECLHNIVKHAGATHVSFSVKLEGMIQIIIHDNGKGIDKNKQRAFSNGLQNIQQRMKKINGEVEFSNEQGTKVVLTIP
jgi:signal transduction histidine kinase